MITVTMPQDEFRDRLKKAEEGEYDSGYDEAVRMITDCIDGVVYSRDLRCSSVTRYNEVTTVINKINKLKEAAGKPVMEWLT